MFKELDIEGFRKLEKDCILPGFTPVNVSSGGTILGKVVF